nr:hypothetical protein [Kibdelosporangium sp. MJ126-NF4]CEL12743.1 hypothetical protein [Kibdelosporangium sp. MJ126-NF4]CTQ93503.1 hypothetical protein [Kibdelosporangium sp. MJ126-NF4]
MGRTVTITGPRSITAESQALLPGLFEHYIGPFAKPGARFYLGGAVGIDTLALNWLAENSEASLIVVVPRTVADQPALAGEAIRAWQSQDRLADVIELRAGAPGSAAYHARNRWMVDHSAFVIGFPQATLPSSGTWYTIDYAADQGKPRLVVPI